MVAACTHYDFSGVLEPPASASVVAERGGATIHFSPGHGATSHRIYAARVPTVTPDNAAALQGVVTVDVGRSPVRLDGLAVDGEPWFVVITALRGGRESAGTPSLAVSPLAVNTPFFEALPSWQESAADVGDGFGSVLASADFNGDGRADLLVGSPLNDSTAVDAGRLELWLGRAAGVPTAPADISFAPGNVIDRHYATSLAVGDFDCDGLDDIAVGFPDDDGLDARGVVDILPGTPLLPYLDHELHASPLVTGTNLGFGFTVASGDVNGDGCADLLVGEEGRAGVPPMVHLFLGGPGGVVDPPTSRAEEQNAELTGWGHALALTDLDGDGKDEIVVGEPDRDANGRVTIFGGVDGLDSAPALVLYGGANSHSGAFLAPGGDVDGDGFEELVVGTRPDVVAAEMFLVHGSSLADGLDITSLASGSSPVALTACAADVDGDGYGDLLVGDPQLPGASTTTGGIVVFLGGPAGVSSSAAWTITAPFDAAFFGSAIAAGDFDGNGTPDIAGGAPRSNLGRGIAYVHEGFPTRGVRADAGRPRVLAEANSLDFPDAWFLDLDDGPHRCDWNVAGTEQTLDDCTPATAGDLELYWDGGRGRFDIRLRVTAQDGRYGEAFSTFVSEVP